MVRHRFLQTWILIQAAVSTKSIEEKITSATKAIIVVHQFGFVANMDAIMKIANITTCLIEDCAQAHGAYFKGQRVGTFGDIGVFSFNVNKNQTNLGKEPFASLITRPLLSLEAHSQPW